MELNELKEKLKNIKKYHEEVVSKQGSDAEKNKKRHEFFELKEKSVAELKKEGKYNRFLELKKELE